jgi:hypothetical protein
MGTPDGVFSGARFNDRFKMFGLMIEKTSTGERTSTRPRMAWVIRSLPSLFLLTESWVDISSPPQILSITARMAARPIRYL